MVLGAHVLKSVLEHESCLLRHKLTPSCREQEGAGYTRVGNGLPMLDLKSLGHSPTHSLKSIER